MRREQSLMVLLSRTELKTGLAQTLWWEVCFLNTTNSPSKAECGFGWFVSPKSILKRGKLACCLLWKQRTDSPISIKYCLSFASGLNHVSGPSDNGSGRHTFSSKHVADSGTVYFQRPADLRQRKSKRTPSTPPRQHKSSFSLMSESKPKENEG